MTEGLLREPAPQQLARANFHPLVTKDITRKQSTNFNPTVSKTSLSREDETKLRAAFSAAKS